ncbi:MAG TPA: helix-turn-helix transcriptional regulator [Terracidiphilus sp.]|nr:helix-turn-helix transcriptional regulator [Terracidiphilus sp.]
MGKRKPIPAEQEHIFYLDKIIALTKYIVMQDNGSPGESGLYNRIAVLRAERGISRQALADAVGVNYQTIGFLERGDYGPSLKLAFQIAQFFALPVEAIFSTQPFRPLSEQVYGARPAPTA